MGIFFILLFSSAVFADPGGAISHTGTGKQTPTRPSAESLSDQQLEWLPYFASKAQDCITHRDTYSSVFHGCVDWHSAVESFGTLFKVARATNDPAWSKIADNALTIQGLTFEKSFLKSTPKFEMPYGRAWFLDLALNYEDYAKQNPSVRSAKLGLMRSIANEVAASMLKYYEQKRPSPLASDYQNDSWALQKLHAYVSHAGTPQQLDHLNNLIHKNFVLSPENLQPKHELSLNSFFSRFDAQAYLIAKTQPAAVAGEFIRKNWNTILSEPLTPKADEFHHHLGLNWNRAWALKAMIEVAPDEGTRSQLANLYRRTVDTALWEAKNFGGQIGVSDRASYRRYDHWVPNFAVYAMTEGSRPDSTSRPDIMLSSRAAADSWIR